MAKTKELLEEQRFFDDYDAQQTDDLLMAELLPSTEGRYLAAQIAGLHFVKTVAGFPLFDGTAEQFRRFHALLGTPTL